ncbi:MAG: VWA domain-containing protein [Acidobacteriota bacterium]
MPPTPTPRLRAFRLPPVLLGLLLLGTAAAATAQGEAPSGGEPAGLDVGFEDLVEVSEVFVDILATDGDGNVVRGLGIDDFVVEEDGNPVTLTGVSYYSTRYGDPAAAPAEAAEPAAAAGDGEVPSSRYFVMFFHDQTRYGYFGANRLMRQQLRAGQDARRWIAEALLPSDWIAVVSYDVKLKVHQDFTQDREVLQRAIERATTGEDPSDFNPSRREAVGRGRELNVLSRLPEGKALRRESRNVYQGLQRVAEASGFLVGRKVMMLYTVGFGVRRGNTGTSLPDPRYYSDLETVLNDHNVAVYPIDLTPSGFPPIQEDFLTRIAEDTGGYYDENFIGFFDPLERIARENYGYYLLTYRTERPAGEVGYQRLEVRARNPEIEVRARTGYRFGL